MIPNGHGATIGIPPVTSPMCLDVVTVRSNAAAAPTSPPAVANRPMRVGLPLAPHCSNPSSGSSEPTVIALFAKSMRPRSSNAPRASPGFLNMTNTLFDIFFLLLCRSRRLSAQTLRHSTALGHYSVAVSGCRLHLGWPCGKSLLVFPNRNDRKYLHE